MRRQAERPNQSLAGMPGGDWSRMFTSIEEGSAQNCSVTYRIPEKKVNALTGPMQRHLRGTANLKDVITGSFELRDKLVMADRTFPVTKRQCCAVQRLTDRDERS